MKRDVVVGVFLLSTATLLYEINLTRLFSVAQFYHFAFMIISLALLGFGSSGTLLALFPGLGRRRPYLTLFLLALSYAVTSGGAYWLTNALPFDSFSIAWNRLQIFILLLHYLALAIPFFCSGAALGLLFVLYPQAMGRVYALNLIGSAMGGLAALFVPNWVGGEGVIWVSGLLGASAALCFAQGIEGPRHKRFAFLPAIFPLGWGLFCLLVLVFRPAIFDIQLSPYKGLSYALQYPGARIVSQRWNGFSRVDVVESGGIRSLPGLSYRYLEAPPPQRGILVDGDDVSPNLQLSLSVLSATDTEALAFAGFLPTAVAYRLRPGGHALILEPRGGLEIWTALIEGAAQVTAVEFNPLVVEAAGDIYRNPRVHPVLEDSRSFVRQTSARYDVLTLALTTPYRPIRSGAYSLAEDYAYTVEAFRDYVACLAPDGMLVVTRWLQTPPSESLRAFALAVTALEQLGQEPERQIVAFRGYATLTLLVKQRPFTSQELGTIRRFAAERSFDLVYAPDLHADEVNRYNILTEPVYTDLFNAYLDADDRAAWLATYVFDVTPPVDDGPFFSHFFKWSQARQVLAEFGKSSQPFGGAGYFVLVALLGLATGASALLIVLPVLALRRRAGYVAHLPRTLGYFALLGLGYLFVEIPLIQHFILFLGHPAYAMTAVLFALLLFSGVGSALSHGLSLRLALTLLVVLVVGYALGLPLLFAATLRLPWAGRAAVAVAAVAPAGFLMGIPFPQGLHCLEMQDASHVPWAWGVNGAMSVVASVLAALLALSFGFRVVFLCGALCYAGAWITAPQKGGVVPGRSI